MTGRINELREFNWMVSMMIRDYSAVQELMDMFDTQEFDGLSFVGWVWKYFDLESFVDDVA